LNVLSKHTYTHETLFNAMARGLHVKSLPMEARHVQRPSRLIQGLPKHIWRAGLTILHSLLRYRPLQAYGTLGLLFALAGAVPFVRYLYFLIQGSGGGHLQSLIAGSVLLALGAQFMLFGMLAKAVSWNREMLEEVLYRQKDMTQWEESQTTVVSLSRLRPADERARALRRVA
jgi:hypothetical protein